MGTKFTCRGVGQKLRFQPFYLAVRCWVGDLMQEKVQKLKRVILPPSLVANDKLALICATLQSSQKTVTASRAEETLTSLRPGSKCVALNEPDQGRM